MKRILLLLILSIGLLVNAQKSTADIMREREQKSKEQEAALEKQKVEKAAIFDHPNKDYIISLEKLNLNEVREFADKLANSGKTKWEFFKIIEDEENQLCRVKYIDSSMPTELKQKIVKGLEQCNTCLYVDYLLYFEGENKDLEIKGTKKYRYREVSGKYLDLFPIWHDIFRPDVTIEKTIVDYNSQELIQKFIGINYKLKKQGDVWTLSNNSNLFEYFKTHP